MLFSPFLNKILAEFHQDPIEKVVENLILYNFLKYIFSCLLQNFE